MPPDEQFDRVPLVRRLRDDLDSLASRAFRSNLTGLLNRAAYEALLAGFADDGQLCVAFMDLTGFKAINDEFTHAGGNATLAEAGRLWAGVAGTITGRAFHFSGDEFVMVFPPDRLADFGTSFATVLAAFTLRFEGREILAHANVGVALPDDGQELEALLLRAELACTQGKASGQPGVQVWSADFLRRPLLEIRWRCSSCSAVVSAVVDSTRATGKSVLCAICGTARTATAA
jgi:diguanylate cyclase (GGDEF)-like protein